MVVLSVKEDTANEWENTPDRAVATALEMVGEAE